MPLHALHIRITPAVCSALEYFGFPVDDAVSLAIISSLLGGGVGLSILFPPGEEEEEGKGGDEVSSDD